MTTLEKPSPCLTKLGKELKAKYEKGDKPLYFSNSPNIGLPNRILVPWVVSDIETVPYLEKMLELLHFGRTEAEQLIKAPIAIQHARISEAYRAINGATKEVFHQLFTGYQMRKDWENPFLRQKAIASLKQKADKTGIDWRKVKVIDNDIVAIAMGRGTLLVNMEADQPYVEDITFCGTEFLGTEHSTAKELTKLFLAEMEHYKPILIGHNFKSFDFPVLNAQRNLFGLQAPYFESLGIQGGNRSASSYASRYNFPLGVLRNFPRLQDTMLDLSSNGNKFIGLDASAQRFGAPGKTGKANRVFEHYYAGENLVNALYCKNDINNNLIVLVRLCWENTKVLSKRQINDFLTSLKKFIEADAKSGCEASIEFMEKWRNKRSNYSRM